MKEVGNVLRILRETVKAIKLQDTFQITQLSNQTINTASLTQDPDNIAVAVIVYSLSKIFERKNYHSLLGWKNFTRTVRLSLEHSIKDLERGDEVDFRVDFENINKAIGKLSGKLKNYVREVFRMAKINKASRIYAHGLSMQRTARLLGITSFELAEYAGTTGISNAPLTKTLDVKSRIKLAMDFFK